MPFRPRRYCAQPGCPVLLPGGPASRCPPHAVALEHTRPNRDVRKWYYTAPWIRLRLSVLCDAAYTCAECGVVQADLAVDHIVKHNGNAELFWNRANLQALCSSCHSRKTAHGF